MRYARLKDVADIAVSNVDKRSADGEQGVLLCNYTDVYYNERITGDLAFMPATATKEEVKRFSLRAGDVLLTKDSETPDDIAVPAYVAEDLDGVVCGYHLARLRPKAYVDGRYLFWCLTSGLTRGQLAAATNGITRFGLRYEAFGEVRIPARPLTEQKSIADYLDRETARIDALIEKKTRLVELAEERRRAALSWSLDRAVPKAPLGRFVTGITQGVSPQADAVRAEGSEWGLLKLSSIKAGDFIPEENKRLPEAHAVDRSLKPVVGDLLVTRSNTPNYVGDCCAVVSDPGNVILCDLIYRLRLDSRLVPEFAAAALLTYEARKHLSSFARGSSQSMVKLRGEDVKATPVPRLSLDDQRSLLVQIGEGRHRTMRLRSRLTRQIELLRERRQALITAAVSGEIAIPGVAA